MRKNTNPLLCLSYRITPEVYEACVVTLGQRLKKKNTPRFLVIGVIFLACGLGSIFYMMAYLHRFNVMLTILAALLSLIGVHNITYYPLRFDKQLRKQAKSQLEKSPYHNKLVKLYFYDEYMDELLPGRENRIMWSSVQSVHREKDFYLLQLTSNNGLVIPREKLEEDEAEKLEELINQMTARQ